MTRSTNIVKRGSAKQRFNGPYEEKARLAPCPFGCLPVVVVSRLTVVPAGPDAAVLETYVRSRKGRGRSCPVSQTVPSAMDNAMTALDLSFGREPFATFAAGLVEKSCCSRQSPLPDGFARHITKGELLPDFNLLFAQSDCPN
jgi:hypothetical protein